MKTCKIEIPRVQSFCFCFSLRSGCLILAYLGIIFGLIAFIGAIVSIGNFEAAIKMQESEFLTLQYMDRNGYDVQTQEEHWQLLKQLMPMLLVSYYFQVILSFITVLSSIILLIGVHRNYAHFIGQWLVYALISMLAELIYQIVVLIMAPPDLKHPMIISYLVGDIIGFGKSFSEII